MGKKGWIKMVSLGMSVAFLGLFGTRLLFAAVKSVRPKTPPPASKVWVKAENGWEAVPAPPSDAPYAWLKDHWERITQIPSGKEWVPSYWGERGWMPAHWCPVIYPDSEAKWIPGHWETETKWISGHWEMTPEVQARVHRTWVPGHREPGGAWIHGYWR